MSYYLMVFDKTIRSRSDFMKWYEEQVEWNEDHDYQSIGVTSTNLKKWFMEMKDTFPPMNGEFSPDEDLESHLTDYCIGHELIYLAFAWSVADEAYDLVRKLAKKYGVGFFDVSNDGDIILPSGEDLK